MFKINFTILYHHGIDGQGKDFAKAQEYYLLEAKIGNASWAYHNLGQLFHYGINNQGSDFAEAEKYYQLAIKAGNTLTYFPQGNLYQYGIHGQFKDLNKAVHMYDRLFKIRKETLTLRMHLDIYIKRVGKIFWHFPQRLFTIS